MLCVVERAAVAAAVGKSAADRKKNSVQTVSTVLPCIYVMNGCHVSSQRDPTAYLKDFLACPFFAMKE
jgi:hypothetical protein